MAKHDLLNRNQRRHFEILFSMLEEELTRIEKLAAESTSATGSLTVVEDDLPRDFADQSRPLLETTRQLVRSVAAELRLSPRHVSRRRSINAALTAAIIRIDDSSPEQLRGYGKVDARFVTELGPSLDAIRESLLGIVALLS